MVNPPYFGEEAEKQERLAVGVDPVEESDPTVANRGRLAEPDNEAHAPGQLCERCGYVISADQDARLRPDGHWVHDQCPAVQAGRQQAG